MAPRSASQAEPYPLSTPGSERLSDRVFSPSKPRAVFSFRTRSTFLNTGPQPIPPSPPLEAPKVDGQSCRFRAKSVARPVRSNPRDQPADDSKPKAPTTPTAREKVCYTHQSFNTHLQVTWSIYLYPYTNYTTLYISIKMGPHMNCITYTTAGAPYHTFL